jgi:uncharacterized protein (TIGR00369 family)
MSVALDAEALQAYLAKVFPQIGDDFTIEMVASEQLRMRLNVAERHLRPGGTVSGPTMFALADVCMYAMVLARIGQQALAVTTNCSIDFMRKPAAGVDMIADCRLLKLGRSLAVGDVLMFSEGMMTPVARASLTYAIPPG